MQLYFPDVANLPAVAFDRESIRVFVPNGKPAVYYLVDDGGALVYFGASMNVRTRLFAHVRDLRRKGAVFARIRWCPTTTYMARVERQEQEKLVAAVGPSISHLCGVVRSNPNWGAQKRG